MFLLPNKACASLDVISDTLRRMPHVDDVDITFSLYDRSVASQTSMTQLVECIGKLSSQLSRLVVHHADNRLDVICYPRQHV